MRTSWLFVPASNERYIQKASESTADVIIYDLEDSVAEIEKEKARDNIMEALKNKKMERQECYVRVNGLTSKEFFEDVCKIVAPNLSGIVVPKVKNETDIFIAEFLIQQTEHKQNISKGSIKLIPLIESAQGILNAYDIAKASSRIKSLAFGAEDYLLDMNIQTDQEENELLYARSVLVTTSRAANIEPPIDSVYVDLQNNKGLRESAIKGKKLGFGGKLLIHPCQINIVNQVYSPTKEEIKEAEWIVNTYDSARLKGDGAVQLNGKMIDMPIVERSRNLLLQIKESSKRKGF